MGADSTTGKARTGSGTAWRTRLALGLLGVAALGYAAFGLLTHVPLGRFPGVLAWMAVAVVVHDGVLVPVTTLCGGGLRKLTRRLDPVQQGIIIGGLLLGALVTLIVLPTLRAQQVLQPAGPASGANDTVLQGNFALSLGAFWLVLVVLGAAAVTGISFAQRLVRVRKTRP